MEKKNNISYLEFLMSLLCSLMLAEEINILHNTKKVLDKKKLLNEF